MTTAEYLEVLIDTKEDMKSAIESKGVTVTGGLSTYADAIDKIKFNDEFIPLENVTDLLSNYGVRFGYSTFKEFPNIDIYWNDKVRGQLDRERYMFANCYNLERLPLLNFGNIRYLYFMFEGCTSLKYLGGFENLGAVTTIDGSDVVNGTDTFISDCCNLTYESIMNVINNLYDRKSAGMSELSLKLHADAFSKLSDEDILIAINKGWILEW